MRILIAIFLLCIITEAIAQRGLRRFRPFRNSQVAANEEEPAAEPKNEEVETKPQRPSRGSGRSRRLFPARFPGSTQQEAKLEEANNIEPVAAPPPPPRRQSSRRRRPQLPKRLTTTSSTTTAAPEILQDEVDAVVKVVEESVQPEESVTLSTTPPVQVKPKLRLRSPIIRNRPILRPSRRNEQKSKQKPKEEAKDEKEMENKPDTPKPLISRHRFARPGLRSHRPAAKKEPKPAQEKEATEVNRPTLPRISRGRQPLRLRNTNSAKKEEKIMPTEPKPDAEPKKKQSLKLRIPENIKAIKPKPKQPTRIRKPEKSFEKVMDIEKTIMEEKETSVKEEITPVKEKMMPVKEKIMPVKEEVMPLKEEKLPMREQFMPNMRETKPRRKIDKTMEVPQVITEEMIVPVPVGAPRIKLPQIQKEMVEVPLPMLAKSRQLDIPLPEQSDLVIPNIPEIREFPQEIERRIDQATTSNPDDMEEETTSIPLEEKVVTTTDNTIPEENTSTTSKSNDVTIQDSDPIYEYYEVIEYLDYIEGQDEPIVTVKERKIASPKDTASTNSDITTEKFQINIVDSSVTKQATKEFEDFTDYDDINETRKHFHLQDNISKQNEKNNNTIHDSITEDITNPFDSMLKEATKEKDYVPESSSIIDLQESESKNSRSEHPNKLPQEDNYYEIYEYYDYPEAASNKPTKTTPVKHSPSQNKPLPDDKNILPVINVNQRINKKQNMDLEKPAQKPIINRKNSKIPEEPIQNPRIIKKQNKIPEEPTMQKPRIRMPKNNLGESQLFGFALIGTVENTPEEEVFEILSGLGSRRRGLSRS